MRHVGIIGALLFVAVGCSNKSDPGGEPGTQNQFILQGPTRAASLKPGDTQTITIKIDRGKEFKQTVNLKAEGPNGIETELHPAAVKPNEKNEIHLKITAQKQAAPGENTVRVTGIPETGKQTSLEVKVKVNKLEDAFTLKGPLLVLTPTIRQGDTYTMTITLNRGADFKQAVKFKADAPKGIKAAVDPAEVGPADKGQVNLRISVDAKAPVGEQTIRVTGTPAAGEPAFLEMKIKIPEPG